MLPFDENRKDSFIFNAKEAKAILDFHDINLDLLITDEIKEAHKKWRDNWEQLKNVSHEYSIFKKKTERRVLELGPTKLYFSFVSDLTYMLDYLRYKHILIS